MLLSNTIKTATYLLGFIALLASGLTPTQEYAQADAIWVHGDDIIVFARLPRPCSSAYELGQAFVSKDNGFTWTKSGPELNGSELKYIMDTGRELLIAGEDYAEGPEHDPYLFLYRSGDEWPQFSIYEWRRDAVGDRARIQEPPAAGMGGAYRFEI